MMVAVMTMVAAGLLQILHERMEDCLRFRNVARIQGFLERLKILSDSSTQRYLRQRRLCANL